MTSAYDAVILAEPSLVSYWPLADKTGTTAADVRGPNSATYQGGYTLGGAAPYPLTMDGSVALGGVSGQVQDASTTGLAAGSSCSLECWFTTSDVAGSPPLIFLGNNNANGYGCVIGGSIPAGHLGLLYGFYSTVDTGFTIANNTWYHVVVVLDSSAHATVYVDGVSVFSYSAKTPFNPSNIITFGSTPQFPTYLAGAMSSVAYYSAALSAGQIAAHYAAAIATPPAPPIVVPAGPGGGISPQLLLLRSGVYSMWTVTAVFLSQVLADIIGSGMSPSGGVLATAWMGLYIAPTTPITPRSTLANITEATYDGYARQELVWYPPYTDLSGPQTITAHSLQFTPTDATVPNVITGIFLASAVTDGTLWMAAALASPGYPLQMPGQAMIVAPQFQLGYQQVYGGTQIVG